MLLTAACLSPLLFQLESQAGLIHRWSFNETTGTNLANSVGATAASVVVLPAGGGYTLNGQSVRLDGGTRSSADYVAFPGSVFAGLSNGTLEIWAEPHSFPNWGRLVDISSGDLVVNPATDNYRLSWSIGTDGNQQRMGLRPLTAVDSALTTPTNVVYHYAIVWSANGGTGGQARIDWYRNGAYVNGQDVGTNLMGLMANYPGSVGWLARSPFTGDSTGNASYHEMRVYSHALSGTEIYVNGVNGPDAVTTPAQQASNLTLTTNGTGRLSLSWTAGTNATGSLVVMSAGQAPTYQPTNGNNYTASANFGSGANLGSSNFVVFASASSSVVVSNLTAGVQYFARVYSYSGGGGGGGSRVYNYAEPPTGSAFSVGVAQSISLQTSSPLLLMGNYQAVVSADFGSGSPGNVTGAATYTSSNTNIATVSVSGLIRARAVGSASIIASYQGLHATNTVDVVDPRLVNLTHRYPFTADASDVVGAANGTLMDGANVANSRLVLNGTTAYAALPPGIVNGHTAFTAEAWVSNAVLATWSRIFDFGTGQTGNMYLTPRAVNSAGALRFTMTLGGEQQINTSSALPANQMKYVAVTLVSNLAVLYLDGVPIGSNTTMTLNPTSMGTATQNFIGKSQYPTDPFFNGSVDEFRLYNAALPPDMIVTNFVQGPNAVQALPGQATGLSITTNALPGRLNLSWTSGTNSEGSLVVMSAAQPPVALPANGTNYPASASFGAGANLGSSNFVVFAGAGTSVVVSNLVPGQLYYAAVYSYSGTGVWRVHNLVNPATDGEQVFAIAQSISMTTPASITLYGNGQASVTADFGTGSPVNVTGSAAFQSLNTSVMTVSAGGLLQGQGVGVAQVVASYQGLQATNTVTVLDPRFTNLKHRYTFATDATDVMGGAHGTLQGGASVAGNQVLFNGSSAFVNLPNNLVTGYTSITIETWVTDNGSAGWGRVFDFGNNGAGEDLQGTGTQYMFLALPGGGGNLRGAITTAGNAGEQIFEWAGNRPAVGAYSHIVWTSDDASNVGRLYVNGVQVGVNSNLTLRPIDLGPTVNNWLGKSVWPDPFFNGQIDEFRIYDIALPVQLVVSNFTAGADALPVPPPQVVNDYATLNPGASALISVLANDLGPAPVTSTLQIVNPPANGSAVVKPNGRVLYTHNGSATTSDAFTYRVQGSLGATSAVATVWLTIDDSLRLANTTMTLPDEPPPVTYTVVDAFPGLFFEDALAIATPPGRTNQIFVAERRGRISYVPDIHAATPSRQVFLDITSQISFDDTPQGERGLLGMAFHPDFESNGYFYVFYVAPGSPYTNRLARFTANPTTLTVNTNTQQPFFDVLDQDFNHNGGDLHFGPDGFLYICMGDEGGQYNARQNAQRIDKDLYSAMLRIDVDRASGIEPRPSANTTRVYTNGLGQAYYTIPASNPFVNATNFQGSITNIYGGVFNTNTLRAEIFATGLRHIWRFSIDEPTGDIWVGDVGQDRWEEVNIVTNGGNYGWGYYEGNQLAKNLYPSQPNLFLNPPPGLSPPLYAYYHANQGGGNPSYEGDSITGGVVYRGVNMPELYGAYLFADFEFQHIWALRRDGTNVNVERLAGKLGIGAFGVDPSNGDILLANYLDNQIQRLVRMESTENSFPQTLSETGVFADLATLAPNPGIVAYEPKVAFWSDHAIKSRWFVIPDLTNTIAFAQDANWSLPSGMTWIKHFDLELERGNPATKKRIETRILKKNDTGNYGVSYKWNEAGTEAFLVPDQGDSFNLTVTNQGVPVAQFYEIPSRSGCLACHTAGGGHALTFNTREMNHEGSLNGYVGNQIDTLAAAGYFSGPVPPSGLLPVHAQSGDTNASLQFRVRSYLSVNCSQCHQANGTGGGDWDGRAHLTLAQTGLINGLLDNTGGNPANRLIVPGDKAHSVVWLRLQGTNGFGRMPAIGSHVLDQTAINLLAAWIDSELTNTLSFADWQWANFGSTNSPNSLPGADPDADGADNYYEWITQTPPLTNAPPPWTVTIDKNAGTVSVGFRRVANVGFVVETGDQLGNWATWNVPDNQLWFGASTYMDAVTGPLNLTETNRFFRVRIVEP
jgi:glucose/arabinose dehydrogenase